MEYRRGQSCGMYHHDWIPSSTGRTLRCRRCRMTLAGYRRPSRPSRPSTPESRRKKRERNEARYWTDVEYRERTKATQRRYRRRSVRRQRDALFNAYLRYLRR